MGNTVKSWKDRVGTLVKVLVHSQDRIERLGAIEQLDIMATFADKYVLELKEHTDHMDKAVKGFDTLIKIIENPSHMHQGNNKQTFNELKTLVKEYKNQYSL